MWIFLWPTAFGNIHLFASSPMPALLRDPVFLNIKETLDWEEYLESAFYSDTDGHCILTWKELHFETYAKTEENNKFIKGIMYLVTKLKVWKAWLASISFKENSAASWIDINTQMN